ncbi:MAG: 3-dehydroquinate synthase [Methylococcales bacterium]|nr:3-dehydroquinate synthase [Methylococcales bacterium]
MNNVKQLRLELGVRSYPIIIGSKLLSQVGILNQYIKGKQVVVVTNTTVAALYLETLKKRLSAYQLECVILPDGEEYKTLNYVEKIWEDLLKAKFNRNATLITLGGGVVGDMGGFSAACYQRGIPFIQIPTTLLAQVDSSVGGKTGVNHALGKNMIGAFYQPQAVLIDISVLKTLDDRQLSAGIAEVIKYGLINDPYFFVWIEQNIERLLAKDEDALTFAIERSCLNKAKIVAEDEHESGVRAILNLGHTFGHAIETGMGYGHYLHGEAVAIGTCLAADLSRRLGYLKDETVFRIIKLFQHAKLPVLSPENLTVEHYLEHMSRDKKNIDGEIRVIILEKIGKASVPTKVKTALLRETLNGYRGV